MIKINARPLLINGVAAIVLSMSAPILADPVAEPEAFIVATDDIDLTSARGVETLHRRVASTIRWACGPIVSWTPASIRAMAECRAEAEAAAAPMLRQLVANSAAKVASN